MNMRLLGLLRALTALLLGLVLFAVSASAEPPRQTPQTQSDIFWSFAPIVRKAQPAVVNVYASRTDKRPRNPLFDDPRARLAPASSLMRQASSSPIITSSKA
jgi:S1-C subfamily serine protease